jgi:hypothetical protein
MSVFRPSWRFTKLDRGLTSLAFKPWGCECFCFHFSSYCFLFLHRGWVVLFISVRSIWGRGYEGDNGSS